jgi:ankyrin repeat protein
MVLCAAAWCSAATEDRLIEAVKRRDAKAAAAFISQHADVNAALPDGATALSWAVFLDLPEIVSQLIDVGANVNTAGEYGETPLTLALANGDVALTKKLLKAGADPKATRWNGETALMIAAGAGSAEEVELLIGAGLDVNATEGHKGQNALMWAAAEGHPGVVDVLIQKGANVNAATQSGFTALAFAIMKNDAVSVQRLVQAGADPNYALPDKEMTKMLTLAVSYHSPEAAVALLEGGADPNIADRHGRTPLHAAAEAGELDLVRKLVSKGANLNARTETKDTPDSILFTLAGEQTPLLIAAKYDHPDIMRALIAAGADTRLKAQDGTTLFLAAAGSGHVEAVRCAYEFDKDAKAVDSFGRNAMHVSVSGTWEKATQPEVTELVQYLVDMGVPLDDVDQRGRTPIDITNNAPLDQPAQRIADIIMSRGGTPRAFPSEYVKPASAH